LFRSSHFPHKQIQEDNIVRRENKIVPDLSIRDGFSIFIPILSIGSLTNSWSCSDYRFKKMATFQEIRLSC